MLPQPMLPSPCSPADSLWPMQTCAPLHVQAGARGGGIITGDRNAARVHAHEQACSCSSMHAHTCMGTRACATCVTGVHTCVHVCMHACHTCHTRKHAHTHARTCMRARTPRWRRRRSQQALESRNPLQPCSPTGCVPTRICLRRCVDFIACLHARVYACIYACMCVRECRWNASSVRSGDTSTHPRRHPSAPCPAQPPTPPPDRQSQPSQRCQRGTGVKWRSQDPSQIFGRRDWLIRAGCLSVTRSGPKASTLINVPNRFLVRFLWGPSP